MDMAQSNEKVVVDYRTQTGNTCSFNDLQDETHYTFNCRCGCGAVLAGYGKDIKSVARIGSQPPESMSEDTQNEIDTARLEFAMKVRPFVSDRYIQKAIFKLSDDEIDELAKAREAAGKVDPVIENGGGAEDNDPPEVGNTVYSKVTRDGPYTVADFAMARVRVNEGNLATVQDLSMWCGILRTTDGRYINIPVGDLVKKLPEPPKVAGPYDHLSPRARAKAKGQERSRREAKRIATTVAVLLLGWSVMATLMALYMAYIWG